LIVWRWVIAIRRSHLARGLIGEQRRPLFGGRVRHPHVALEIVEGGVWIPSVISTLSFEVLSDVPTELCYHVRQLLGCNRILVCIEVAAPPRLRSERKDGSQHNAKNIDERHPIQINE
jgi:hypothetical protein